MKRCFFSLWLLMISTNIAPAESDWWSWQPLAPPRIPASEGETTIDRFISATLATKELTPSPQADQRTLIRRLYFDLIGLPPSMAEVDAFVKDDDAQAYAKLVDRLLESPHYGERWARHWLDVVHYGETHGYDKDKPRMNAWPYGTTSFAPSMKTNPMPASSRSSLQETPFIPRP